MAQLSWDEMKKEDVLPTSAAVISGGKETALFVRGDYKFWALAAITLIAFWSVLTGAVTLKWSAGNLIAISVDHNSSPLTYIDVLEVEEREKLVRKMWDVYAHSRHIPLPRFWQEAFEAAYEELSGDETVVRDGAVAEIARMSMTMVDLQQPLRQSKRYRQYDQKKGDEIAKPKSSLSGVTIY